METIFNLRILKRVLKISINIFLIDRLRNGSIRDLSIFFLQIVNLEKMHIHIYLSSKRDFYLASIPLFLLFSSSRFEKINKCNKVEKILF